MADTKPGEWHRYVLSEIRRLRHSIADGVRRQQELESALRHVLPHSAQDGTLRDVIRLVISQRTLEEIDLRRFRGLLRTTKPCPRCKGRGQKYDRRRSGRRCSVYRPCSLCRAQGYLWVHP